MWPPWVKTRTNPSPNPSHQSGGALARSPTFSFSFSTLKGVQTLLRDGDDDDDNGGASSSSSSSPSLRIFHRVRVAASALRALRALTPSPSPSPSPDDRRVVLYFTSLRVVRKTFEDCRAVRSILRGLRAPVDERDVAMDTRFRDELRALLLAAPHPHPRHRRPPPPRPALPQLFVGARCLGGADEIRRLHESGDLRRLLDGASPPPPAACELCGGARFVLCQSCSGSHKRYSEKLGFRSCAACNENGLARCPACCPPAV